MDITIINIYPPAPRLRHFRCPTMGFSLLELLIVLAMAGLMLALVPPLFGNALASAEARTTARQITAALKQTRSTAVAGQNEAVLILDLRTREFQLEGGEKRRSLPENIAVTLTTAESERIAERAGGIRFFADGSSTGGRIELRTDTQYFVIDVDWLTGRISVES
jgi:general secretion pathway protein H